MNERGSDTLCIYALGGFRLRLGGVDILDATEGMSKVWNVFKYLLANRDLRVPGEVICEVFWPDAPWRKARHSLYNAVYKVRNTLEAHGLEPNLLVIRDGMYSFNRNSKYWMDSEVFDQLCHQAQKLGPNEAEEALQVLGEAVELYQGDFLSENFYDDWVKGAQQRYRSLYRRAAVQYANLLTEYERYDEAREVCEQALDIEPLDEDLQLVLMRAYIKEGNVREAKHHYEKYADAIFRESGVLPSKRMRDLFQRIQEKMGGSSATDLEAIQELLERQDDSVGAHLCDGEAFQELYQLERKRISRNGTSAYLVKVDLVKPDLRIVSTAELESAAKCLGTVLKSVLRAQDVVCRWSDSQFLLLLSGLNGEGLQRARQRISDEYQKRTSVPVAIRCRERLIPPSMPPFGMDRKTI